MTTAAPPLSFADQMHQGLQRIGAPPSVLEFVEEWRRRVFHPAVREVLSTRERHPEALGRLIAEKSRQLWESFERLLQSIAEMMRVPPDQVVAVSAERSAAAESTLTQEQAVDAFADPAATNAYLWSLEEFDVVSKLGPEDVPKAAHEVIHGASLGLMVLGVFIQEPNIGDRDTARALAHAVRGMVLRTWTLRRKAVGRKGPRGTKGKRGKTSRPSEVQADDAAPPSVHWPDERAPAEGVPEVHWD